MANHPGVAIKKRRKHYFRKNSELFFLALPAVLFFIVFNYLPMFGLLLPFKEFRISDRGFFTELIQGEWVGLKNFRYLFTSETARVTRNTIVFNVIFIIVGLVFAVMFALMLFELTAKFVKLYQTILFLPYFISWVVAGYLFLGLLDMDHGFINTIIKAFGGSPVAWYNEPNRWYFILPIANLWKGVGYGTIMYYTSLLSIDPELFEAAELDGASRWQRIRTISLPMLRPLMVMLTLMSIGSIIKADFGLFFNVTRDSAMLYPVTDVIDTFVYRALRQLNNVGMSAAASFYQAVVGFILVMVSNWLVRKISPEDSLF